MFDFKYSSNEINNYINSLPRDKELYISDKFSLKIKEDYIETSYEWFEHDVSAIELYYKFNDNIIVKENLFDWIHGTDNEKHPTLLDGFAEVLNQLKDGIRDLSLPNALNTKFLDDIKDEQRRYEQNLFNDELYKYDKNLPLSTITGNGHTSYFTHFFEDGEDLLNIINILSKKNDLTAKNLIQKAQKYLKQFAPKVYEEYIKKEENMDKKKKFKEFTPKEKLRYTDITNTLIKSFEDNLMNNSQKYWEFIKAQNQFNMADYSFRNRIWLWNQATVQDFVPYFATFKEWNREKLSIKAGEHGMSILIPFSKKTIYWSKVNQLGEADGVLPTTLSEEELKERNMKVAEDGNLLRKFEVQEYFQKACIFSISQTNATPDMIPDIYKTYNVDATGEENKNILEKMKKFCSAMGIKYVEDKSINSLLLNGSNSHYWSGEKVIKIKEELPTDAKIMVLSHEIGHELMKHLDNSDIHQKTLSHDNQEIQAQLFSDMVLDYFKINTQDLYSKDYIAGYLKMTKQSPFWKDEESWKKLKASQLLANVEAVEPVVSLFKEAYENDFADMSKIENRQILHVIKSKDEYGIAREKQQQVNTNQDTYKEVEQNEINGMEMD